MYGLMSVMSAVGLNGLVLRDARLQGIFSEFRLLGSRVSVQNQRWHGPQPELH